MKSLGNREISGNWATLLLPIEKDNSICYQRLQNQIDQMIRMGVDGIYSNGTAGEFFNQTEEEFDRINTLLAEKCHAAGMPFQIGCSHVNPLMSLERIKRAVQMKPGAIQVILPDWIACDINEAKIFLTRVVEITDDIGIVLYNPAHARKQLMPSDFLALKDAIPSLAGCKVPWMDTARIAEMARRVPEVSLFVPGHFLASGFSHGARGAYSNVACIHPGASQRWYQSMRVNLDSALEVETRIRSFMDTCIRPYIDQRGYSNTGADKFLASIGGWSDMTPRLRWPYKSIPESDVPEARKVCKTMLPEFFER